MKLNKLMSVLALAVAACALQSVAFAGEYTDKSYHDGEHTYKHPFQRSFTGPFDYGNLSKERPAPAPMAPPAGRCNQFTFDATKSYDVDRQKLTTHWEFGDGTTSDEPVVTHVYEKAGEYNVTLSVKDSSGLPCDSGVTSTKVNANFPPTCVAGENKIACVGEAVSFSSSGSTASGPATYHWDFGDGTSADGETVSHAYEKSGNYRVVLSINDGKNTECSTAACSITVGVSERVTVALEAPESGCTGRSLPFRASSTGASKLRWDFGDGTTAEGGSSMSHAYQKGGTYTVTVTADSGQNNSCSSAVDSKRVKVNGTPIADAGENLVCCVGKDSVFDATKSSDPDGDALTYHWDFGDGATSDEARTTHVYEKSGTYRVSLTVKDSSGSDCGMSGDSFSAVVNTSPEAVIEVR